MLSNVYLSKLIECKARRDGHVVKEPILLPCGYSVCRECYKNSKFCNECNINHQISENQLNRNKSVENIVKQNIEELIFNVKKKYKEQKLKTESKFFLVNNTFFFARCRRSKLRSFSIIFLKRKCVLR